MPNQRSENSEKISISLDKDLLIHIRKLAEADHRSVSNFLNINLRQMFPPPSAPIVDLEKIRSSLVTLPDLCKLWRLSEK